MLASTVQFSTNDQPTTTREHQHHPKMTGMNSKSCLAETTTILPRPCLEAPTPSRRAGPGCSFRTQQGAKRHPQPHPHTLSLPITGSYSCCEPLPVPTGQCLRLRAPRSDRRGPRAPGPGYGSRCSLERR